MVFARVAEQGGFDPEDAARRLRRFEPLAELIPDVDWDALDRLTLDYADRDLLAPFDAEPEEGNDLSTSWISAFRIIEVAEKAGRSAAVVARRASELAAVGVRLLASVDAPDIVPRAADCYLVQHFDYAPPERWLRVVAEELVRADRRWQTSLDRILTWLPWLLALEEHGPEVADALRDVRPPGKRSRFDSTSGAVVGWAEDIAGRCGAVGRAHLIEISGVLGLPIGDVQDVLAPFVPALQAWGYDVSSVPNPPERPPDWLDVAVVGLLVGRPAHLRPWDDDVAAFLSGNLDAPLDDLAARFAVWAPVLRDDPFPNAYDAEDRDRTLTGMYRWPPDAAVSM